MSELKPCPLCGSENLDKWFEPRGAISVRCKKCFILGPPSFKDWDHALERWNTRTVPTEFEKQHPPVWVECVACGGEGYIQHSVNPDDGSWCEVCNGTGNLPNYLTPEQYTQWMRTEGGQPDYVLPDTAPVWHRGSDDEWWIDEWGEFKDCKGAEIIVITSPDLPKPDKDWRPK